MNARIKVRMICAVISAAGAVTAAAIKAEHHAVEPLPSSSPSDDPCHYRIGDQDGHLSVCDVSP
jgi:hypothetical protein